VTESDQSALYSTRTATEISRMVGEKSDICPVCQFSHEGVVHHIDALFYEQVNDPGVREKIRKARGFCRFHARMIARQRDELGSAIILKDVLSNDLHDLQHGTYDHPPHTASRLSRFLEGSPLGHEMVGAVGTQTDDSTEARPTACPICQTELDLDALGIDGLLEALGGGDLEESYRRSNGLCMPHFRLAFTRCDSEDRWSIVQETQEKAIDSLVSQLDELARKHDYRYRDDPQGAEAGSWLRGLAVTSGSFNE
jgi:hypothetical protein